MAVKLLNGDINNISGRPAADARYFSPERVQLLAITLMVGVSTKYHDLSIIDTSS